jgi:hypothetical protein
MIVCDLDIIGVSVDEAEAYPPLVIDGNRVLTLSIPPQAVQTVARGNPQVIEAGGIIDVLQASGGSFPKIGRQPLGPAIHVQRLGMLVPKCLDHEQFVTRNVTIVNRKATLIKNESGRYRSPAHLPVRRNESNLR